ncbi:MAG: recombinase family protein [Acidobacteriaceae bacterium]|nr:recombinase family protein [Acidobacteriaceae bacterium]
MMQRSRDLISGQLTLDYFMRKAAEGWTVAAVEWVREVEDSVPAEPISISFTEDLPYGMQLSGDGLHLEANPLERTVLLLILDKIVQEKRITQIATELNEAGFRTRHATPWTPSSVFELLPRLIEAGPALLKSSEWQEVRGHRSRVH